MEMKFKLPYGNFKPKELGFLESDCVWVSEQLFLFYYGNGVVSITTYEDKHEKQLGEVLSELIKLNPEMEIKGISGPISKKDSVVIIAVFGKK